MEKLAPEASTLGTTAIARLEPTFAGPRLIGRREAHRRSLPGRAVSVSVPGMSYDDERANHVHAPFAKDTRTAAKFSSARTPYGEITDAVMWVSPRSSMCNCLAAESDRSIIRPRLNGPRSFTTTSTVRRDAPSVTRAACRRAASYGRL